MYDFKENHEIGNQEDLEMKNENLKGSLLKRHVKYIILNDD